jgi:hypothetical protein
MVLLVAAKEYAWWAPRVAAPLIRMSAAVLVPRDERVLRRDEWLAELDMCRSQSSGGLVFAMLMVVAGLGLRVSSTWHHLQWLKQPSLKTASWSLPLWVDAITVVLSAMWAISCVLTTVKTRDLTWLLQALAPAAMTALLSRSTYRRRPGGPAYATTEELRFARLFTHRYGHAPVIGRERRQRWIEATRQRIAEDLASGVTLH